MKLEIKFFGLGSRMAKFMRAEKNSGFKLTEHGILEIEPEARLPFVASTMYIIFQRKTNHFTENNTKN